MTTPLLLLFLFVTLVYCHETLVPGTWLLDGYELDSSVVSSDSALSLSSSLLLQPCSLHVWPGGVVETTTLPVKHPSHKTWLRPGSAVAVSQPVVFLARCVPLDTWQWTWIGFNHSLNGLQTKALVSVDENVSLSFPRTRQFESAVPCGSATKGFYMYSLALRFTPDAALWNAYRCQRISLPAIRFGIAKIASDSWEITQSSEFSNIPWLTQTACGNGIVDQSREGCDDGNSNNGDGCDSSCNVEPGFLCSLLIHRNNISNPDVNFGSLCACQRQPLSLTASGLAREDLNAACRINAASPQGCVGGCNPPFSFCNFLAKRCECAPGHQGPDCRTCDTQNGYHPLYFSDKSLSQCIPCHTKFCSPHSSCKESVLNRGSSIDVNYTICVCEGGWTGPFCDVRDAPGLVLRSPYALVPLKCDSAACGTRSDCNQISSSSYSVSKMVQNANALQCACKDGFGGNKCSMCNPGFWGASCQPCTKCNSFFRSVCVADQTRSSYSCLCPENFEGEKCDRCAAGFVGPNCNLACPVCYRGYCKADRSQAVCVCEKGFSGTNCDKRAETNLVLSSEGLGTNVYASAFTMFTKVTRNVLFSVRGIGQEIGPDLLRLKDSELHLTLSEVTSEEQLNFYIMEYQYEQRQHPHAMGRGRIDLVRFVMLGSISNSDLVVPQHPPQPDRKFELSMQETISVTLRSYLFLLSSISGRQLHVHARDRVGWYVLQALYDSKSLLETSQLNVNVHWLHPTSKETVSGQPSITRCFHINNATQDTECEAQCSGTSVFCIDNCICLNQSALLPNPIAFDTTWLHQKIGELDGIVRVNALCPAIPSASSLFDCFV